MGEAFPNSKAAWAVAEKQIPLEVGPGLTEYKPEANEVVIKVHYAAVNPTDFLVSFLLVSLRCFQITDRNRCKTLPI